MEKKQEGIKPATYNMDCLKTPHLYVSQSKKCGKGHVSEKRVGGLSFHYWEHLDEHFCL